MPPTALLGIQITLTFVTLILLSRFVVAPWLATLPRRHSLLPLLWVHAPRYVPLALLAPGQTDPAASSWAVQTIAWGDFIAALFALFAIVAVATRGERGIPWVWLFSVVSSLDILAALSAGLGTGIHQHALGVSWYVLTLYVPVVCVSQGLIFWQLWRKARTNEAGLDAGPVAHQVTRA